MRAGQFFLQLAGPLALSLGLTVLSLDVGAERGHLLIQRVGSMSLGAQLLLKRSDRRLALLQFVLQRGDVLFQRRALSRRFLAPSGGRMPLQGRLLQSPRKWPVVLAVKS